MALFADKIARQDASTIYYVRHNGSGDIDMFSYLLAVPAHKQVGFNNAITEGGDVKLEDHGHLLYYGAGTLTETRIAELLQKQA